MNKSRAFAWRVIQSRFGVTDNEFRLGHDEFEKPGKHPRSGA